jgi:hypothetical protein
MIFGRAAFSRANVIKIFFLNIWPAGYRMTLGQRPPMLVTRTALSRMALSIMAYSRTALRRVTFRRRHSAQ